MVLTPSQSKESVLLSRGDTPHPRILPKSRRRFSLITPPSSPPLPSLSKYLDIHSTSEGTNVLMSSVGMNTQPTTMTARRRSKFSKHISLPSLRMISEQQSTTSSQLGIGGGSGGSGSSDKSPNVQAELDWLTDQIRMDQPLLSLLESVHSGNKNFQFSAPPDLLLPCLPLTPPTTPPTLQRRKKPRRVRSSTWDQDQIQVEHDDVNDDHDDNDHDDDEEYRYRKNGRRNVATNRDYSDLDLELASMENAAFWKTCRIEDGTSETEKGGGNSMNNTMSSLMMSTKVEESVCKLEPSLLRRMDALIVELKV